MHSVSGVVTLDGKPVEGAAIVFTPTGEGLPASGTTDAQGRYELMSLDKKGATEGTHQVTVTKVQTVGTNRAPEGSDFSVGVKTEFLVPQKYANAGSSGLTAEVKRGQKEYNFDLVSKP
jgi:hypothetical protein